MHNRVRKKHVQGKRRAMRVRKALRGTGDCPRLCVTKSNKHLVAQLIDDDAGKTIACVGSLCKENRSSEVKSSNRTSAKELGTALATKAQGLGVKTVIFDRGKAKYHGVLAEFADAARAVGLQF